MNFHILTLFPEMVMGGLNTSITGRAIDKGLISVEAVNIRDYTQDKHNKVDDMPYGGGMGMIMAADPIYNCYKSLVSETEEKPRVIYMSPKGEKFTQEKARELSRLDRVMLICGHYEGVDERVIEEIVDEEISIGDYVLTGGELPALTVADAVCRMLPGVLSDDICFEEESHFSGLLEYPQYTRPRAFEGLTVPEPLLNGNHAHIVDWQLSESLYITLRRRPEMAKAYLDGRKFTRHQQKVVDAVFDRIREEDEAAKAQTEEQP